MNGEEKATNETGTKPTERSLALRPPQDVDRLAYEPADARRAMEAAKWLVSARIFEHLKTPEQAFAIMAQGKELGLSMMQSINGINVIRGRPTLAAQAQVALIRDSGKAVYFKCTESTEEQATWEAIRRDDPTGEPVRSTYTIGDARRMELTNNSNWKKQPKTMLMWRAATQLARMEYSDVLMGLYDPDEMRDTSPQPRESASAPRRDIQTVSAPPQDEEPPVPEESPPQQEDPPEDEATVLRTELVGIQTDVLKTCIEIDLGDEEAGRERAKSAWYSKQGPGDLRGVRKLETLRDRRVKADQLLRKLEQILVDRDTQHDEQSDLQNEDPPWAKDGE